MSATTGPILAVDGSSPISSVAIAWDGRLLAARQEPGGPSARPLVALLAETTLAAGLTPRDLGGLVAVRGPGSFTGLRLGLATAWALHEALGLPAIAVTAFEALAWQAGEGETPILALVNALRGEWYCQRLRVAPRPLPIDGAEILPASEMMRSPARLALGFGVSSLRELAAHLPFREPDPLAPELALAYSRQAWNDSAETLLAPLYLRAPTPESRLARVTDRA